MKPGGKASEPAGGVSEPAGRPGGWKKIRPRGQRCVLGRKGDKDKEREALVLTDGPTNGHILS